VKDLGQVSHVDVAGTYDQSAGKVSLFVLNRDLSSAHPVEILWEDAAPSRVLSAALLTGDDLKASNSFASPQRVKPQSFTISSASAGRTKFEVPARSYVVVQWTL
jgi:alpha-N-arabinofuranosidase